MNGADKSKGRKSLLFELEWSRLSVSIGSASLSIFVAPALTVCAHEELKSPSGTGERGRQKTKPPFLLSLFVCLSVH